jgi:hypothetical protein
MNPVRNALYSRLAGDQTLAALVSGIHHQVAPRAAQPPFVVFARQTGTPVWQMHSASVQDDTWQVKAIDHATTASHAEDAAQAIAAALTDRPLQLDTGLNLAIYRQSDVDYLETEGADQWHHVGAIFRVVTQDA